VPAGLLEGIEVGGDGGGDVLHHRNLRAFQSMALTDSAKRSAAGFIRRSATAR
jgi:hypothetical protein